MNAPYPPGSGSLGPGRCADCGTPWVWNVMRRLWVASCNCVPADSQPKDTT